MDVHVLWPIITTAMHLHMKVGTDYENTGAEVGDVIVFSLTTDVLPPKEGGVYVRIVPVRPARELLFIGNVPGMGDMRSPAVFVLAHGLPKDEESVEEILKAVFPVRDVGIREMFWSGTELQVIITGISTQ